MNATDPLTANMVLPPRAKPSRWRIWLQAVRFFSFTASAIPILVGIGARLWLIATSIRSFSC